MSANPIAEHLGLFIVVFGLGPILLILSFVIPQAKRDARLTTTTAALRATGQRATIVLTTMRQVGWLGGRHDGAFVFEFIFTLEGVVLTRQCVVSQLARPSVTPGASLPICYRADEQQLIALDLEQLGYR